MPIEGKSFGGGFPGRSDQLITLEADANGRLCLEALCTRLQPIYDTNMNGRKAWAMAPDRMSGNGRICRCGAGL